VAVSPPSAIALHLILGIEAVALHQAFAQAKCHAGVVGPLAGLQVKRATANHVRKRFKRVGRLEFQCGAERIPGSEPEQRAVVAVPQSPAARQELVVEPPIRFNIDAVLEQGLLFLLAILLIGEVVLLLIGEILRGR
jgi:hypothetical protein